MCVTLYTTMSNLRITININRGLLGSTTKKSTSYQQVINKSKSNTQVILSFMNLTHSSTQFTHSNLAFITTPDSTFAHLHSTNNKE